MENFERINVDFERARGDKSVERKEELWEKALEDNLELDGDLENLPI